jgi:hypothetical protein
MCREGDFPLGFFIVECVVAGDSRPFGATHFVSYSRRRRTRDVRDKRISFLTLLSALFSIALQAVLDYLQATFLLLSRLPLEQDAPVGINARIETPIR